jgi:hypothetical protein
VKPYLKKEKTFLLQRKTKQFFMHRKMTKNSLKTNVRKEVIVPGWLTDTRPLLSSTRISSPLIEKKDQQFNGKWRERND